MLSQPTPAEIESVFARGRAALPHAAKRFDAALQYMDAVNLFFSFDDTWRVLSQSEPGMTYTVTNHTCTCANWMHHGAALTQRYYCKHLLAIHAYRRILTDQMDRRILGDWQYTSDRDHCANHPGSMIIVRNSYASASVRSFVERTDRAPRHVCTVQPTNPNKPAGELCTWRPADATEYHRFALWLALVPQFDRPPLTPPVLTPPEAEPYTPHVRSLWRAAAAPA